MDEKPRILIVDDDENTRKSLALIFGKNGYETEGASTGKEAVEKAGKKFFHVALLDIRLPDVKGEKLIPSLKELHPDTTVIMVTGYASLENTMRSLNEGASAYILKPLNMDEVLAKVREAVHKQRLVVENRRLYKETQKELEKRKKAELKLNESLKRIEKSRSDMLSILNQLNIPTAIVDEQGCVTFLSEAGQRILKKSYADVEGVHWEELFPFEKQEKTELKAMMKKPPHLQRKVSVHMKTPGGCQYWLDVSAHDDPYNPKRKILYLYDMSEIYNLRRQLEKKAQYHDLVGKSSVMQRIYQQIQEVSGVDWTVLIEGETGSGKELVARALHFSGHRKDMPFIAVNCAVLPDSLLASQLFGHKRGAFTGAVEDHKGMFETAAGGTVFLDEIGDMPQNIQSTLLRAIEEKEITRLGESTPRKVDVRIITATHHNLSEAAKNGTFRMDLFYRIRVARIKLPPLRERRDDIPLLVNAFLSDCRAATGKSVHDVSNKAMRRLLDYHWPGNVRELKSAMEFAVTHCKKSVIQAEDLPPELIEPFPAQLKSGASRDDERQRIIDALKQAGGKRTLAARLLGMSRATLYRRLADFDL